MKPQFKSILLETGPQCNLNCIYCYNYWKKDGPGENTPASFKDVKRVIKTLCKSVDFRDLVFTGGEPFMNKGIIDLVMLARIQGREVSIISNGNLAQSEDLQILQELGVYSYMITVNSSDQAVHDGMAGKKGAFDASYSAIRNILSRGGKIAAAIVITRKNSGDIGKTVKMLSKTGVKRFMIDRVTITGSVTRNPEGVIPSLTELRQAFALADTAAKEYGVVVKSNMCTPVCALDPDKYPNIKFTSCPLPNGIHSPTVDWQGNVRACQVSPIVIGNIFKNSWQEILESEYVQEWKTSKPDFCTSCTKYEDCKGGCRAAAQQNGKGLNEPDPLVRYLNLSPSA